MNSTHLTSEIETTRKTRARRRATRALVANYIHELSERHERRQAEPRMAAPSPVLNPCEAQA